jgi:hypothetical protein
MTEHSPRSPALTPATGTLYTVTVDTEEEWDWDGDYPIQDLGLQNIQHLPELQAVCDRRGAKVTYFVNHAVLAAPESRQVVLELARHPRVEIGMHIHPWNTPPIVGNGKVTPRETFLHNLPPDLARAKLESVYRQFFEHGLRPTSFRGGRYSTGPVIQEFLQDHGLVADASILPFSTWSDDGAPDHRHRRIDPVRLPPRRSGHRALWEIPLTLGFTRRPFGLWHQVFETVASTPLRHLRLIGLAEKVGLVRKAWLNIETPLGQRPRPFLEVLRRLRLPCIDVCLHSSSLVAGGNLFTRTQADRERVLANLDETLNCVSAWDEFQPATVTEVANHLEEQHARSGN